MLRTMWAALAAAMLVATPAAAADEINFGIISTESSSNLKKAWDPFLADMEKGTGLKINAFFASDYAGVIEAMRFKKVQIAWYGNKSAMEAVDRADGEVFVQMIAKDGSDGYHAHILVHKDSPFHTLDDILKCDKSLDFGIGDPNSTSGFLVPTTFVFAARNIDPKQCFKSVRVANKLVNAATNNNEAIERLEKTAPDKAKEIRVIWTSPLIPSDPLVWRKDLDPALKEKISTWILGYGKTDREKQILEEFRWAGFKKSDNNQLLPIRQMEVSKEIMKLKADEKVTAAEKSAKLAELEKQFSDLDKQIAALKK